MSSIYHNHNDDIKYIYYKKIKKFALLFFVIGSLTCFASWMTFTPITFGYPIIFYYLLKSDNNYSIKNFFKIALSYLLGFILTWLSKWILKDLLYNTNIIKNAVSQISFRYNYSYPDVKLNPLIVIIKNCFGFGIINIVLYIIIQLQLIKQMKFKINLKNPKNKIYLLIGLIPFLTYLIIPNHAMIHSHLFTGKLLVLAESSILIIIIDSNNHKKGETKNEK